MSDLQTCDSNATRIEIADILRSDVTTLGALNAHLNRDEGPGRVKTSDEYEARMLPHVRIEVLAGKERGRRFWRDIGFDDNAFVMERVLS